MKRAWGIGVHLGLLVVAAGLALYMSGRTVESTNSATGPATDLWRVEPGQLSRVELESPDKRVILLPKRDGAGEYSVITVESLTKPDNLDAGVASAPTIKQFISIDAAEKVKQALARFRVLRTIGKVDQRRAAEFGLDKPEGTLRITILGGIRVFTIGSSTPGGGNYYARDEQSGSVQVAVGEPISSMLYADSRMVERDLHGFKSDEPSRVAIVMGQKSRELARVPNKPGAWADLQNSAKEDETATNWMSKLAQLRVAAYAEKPNVAPEPVFRVAYSDAKAKLGFIELFKPQGDRDATYWVRTERSRWYAEVAKTQAEQLERDVAIVVK